MKMSKICCNKFLKLTEGGRGVLADMLICVMIIKWFVVVAAVVVVVVGGGGGDTRECSDAWTCCMAGEWCEVAPMCLL